MAITSRMTNLRVEVSPHYSDVPPPHAAPDAWQENPRRSYAAWTCQTGFSF